MSNPNDLSTNEAPISPLCGDPAPPAVRLRPGYEVAVCVLPAGHRGADHAYDDPALYDAPPGEA